MANKFTTYVQNHSPSHIEIVGLVMIYVTCYLSQCVYYDVKCNNPFSRSLHVWMG
jgi:hypothetical protein